MPPTDVQRKMLRRVVRAFLDQFGESTPRQDLVIEFQNLRDLDDLAYRHLLKSYARTGDDYLPTALAFHYCGDAALEHQARRAVQILAKVLRKQFLSRQIRLSREGLEEDARAIDPSCDQKTIELGIYLGPDFSLFQSYVGGNETKPVITPTQISERIVETKTLDTLWDDFMRDSRPWPSQDSSGGVVPATILDPSQGDGGLPKTQAKDRNWSRADKIAAAALIVTIIAVVVGVTVPEVRVWVHLDKMPAAPTPAPASGAAPNVPASYQNARTAVPAKQASEEPAGTRDEAVPTPTTAVGKPGRDKEPPIPVVQPRTTSDNSNSGGGTAQTVTSTGGSVAQPTPSSNAPSSNSEAKTQAAPPAPEVTAEANGFVFTAQACKRITDLLVCSGSVTNKLQSRLLDLNAQTEGISTVVDSNGTQYRLVPPDPHTLVFGATGRRQQLETDIPINFTITIHSVSPTATSVNLLLACWTSEPYGFFGVTLRKVPIE
jgi:hypothetical protein